MNGGYLEDIFQSQNIKCEYFKGQQKYKDSFLKKYFFYLYFCFEAEVKFNV